MRLSSPLCQKYIIQPISTLTSPREAFTFGAQASQFTQAELAARITSLFICIFAAADAFTHLLTGAYKSLHLILRRNNSPYSTQGVLQHLQQTVLCIALAILGPLVGMIHPKTLLKCFDSANSLIADVASGRESPPFIRLKEFWKTASLQDKKTLVTAFSTDISPHFKLVRKCLASIVYKRINASREVKWLSTAEVSQSVGERINNIWNRSQPTIAFYFHGTKTIDNLSSILKSKKIEVRSQSLKGAFVSTNPEISYGPFYLALKKEAIEWLSPLENGYYNYYGSSPSYWAGFSKDIPVTPDTLAYIIFDNTHHYYTNEYCMALQQNCQKWAGSPIPVVLISEISDELVATRALDMGVPREWAS